MLRIIIVETPTEQRLVLYGELLGPWIEELQTVWENLRRQLGNRSSVIDLNEVTLIDDGADQLLATMLEQGAELVARGMANRWLIQALKSGKNRLAVRALRPRAAVFSHTVDTERNEVTTIAEGTVTLDEVRAHLHREKGDSALPYRELIDARNAVVKLSSSEVHQIVELLRSLARSRGLGRTAVVVSTDVAYGIMRMLQILVADVCVVKPFRDLAAATLWLSDGTRKIRDFQSAAVSARLDGVSAVDGEYHG
jgi:ABC-type transporter Mla MlaB component